MKKIKLDYKAPDTVTITYNGQLITVNPFINTYEQSGLISQYLIDLNTPATLQDENGNKVEPSGDFDIPYRIYYAEISQMLFILYKYTNIDLGEDNLDEDGNVDKEAWDAQRELYGSEVWYLVKNAIRNYEDFRKNLDLAVDLYDKKYGTLSKLAGMFGDIDDILSSVSDINPEALEKLQAESLNMLEQLESSSIIADANKYENKDIISPEELKEKHVASKKKSSTKGKSTEAKPKPKAGE